MALKAETEGSKSGSGTPPEDLHDSESKFAATVEECAVDGSGVAALHAEEHARRQVGERLVLDFRCLNLHCVRSEYKVENLKKLLRLARKND
ncbi:hypothetical protein CYMTET_43268 [Cymbomonas tetramitiformis]|uniref:Uncharacterized protein n=1 Tax=Cymbomonas tetramitiformis TaxID=36881 RepID=A0AAE0F1T8_9CHLO|nr:hypothetical protein CYMTET_43268 [Cymbomonas tetramitiformis]